MREKYIYFYIFYIYIYIFCIFETMKYLFNYIFHLLFTFRIESLFMHEKYFLKIFYILV